MKLIRLGFIGHRNESGRENGLDSHVVGLIERLSLESNFEITSYCHKSSSKLDSSRVFVKSIMSDKSFLRPVNALVGACLLRMKGVEVLHLHGLNTTLFLPLFRPLFKKVIVTFHSNDWMYPKWGRFQRLIIYLSYLSFKYSSITRVFVSKSFFENYASGDSHLIYNGSFEEVKELNLSEGNVDVSKETVVIVGRITPEKCQLELCEYFKDSSINFQFYGPISGEGDYEQRFLSLISTASNLQYMGLLDNCELREMLTHSIYVNASRNEGLSIANVEGAALAPYSFFSDIPANRELSLPEDFYFNSYEDLSVKLKSLNYPRLTASDRRNIIKKFSWSNAISKLKSIYGH